MCGHRLLFCVPGSVRLVFVPCVVPCVCMYVFSIWLVYSINLVPGLVPGPGLGLEKGAGIWD